MKPIHLFTLISSALLLSSCGMSEKEMKTAIFEAAKSGNTDIIEKIMDKKPDFAKLESKRSRQYPLNLAANREIAKMLVDAGADVNQKNGIGLSPIFTATSREVVDFLVENGADPISKSGSWRPIDKAANPQVAAALLKHGATIENERGRPTALIQAVEDQRKDVVEFLISVGADPNANLSWNQNSFNRKNTKTLLHIASERGDAGTAEVLINNGADVNAMDRYGATPLHHAALHSKIAVAKLLLDNGADVHAKLRGNTVVKNLNATIHRVGHVPQPLGEKGAGGNTPYEVAKSKAMKDLIKKHGGGQ